MSTKAYDFFIMDKSKLNNYLLYAKKVMSLYLIAHFREHSELGRILNAKKFDEWDKFKEILPDITKAMQSLTYTDKDHLDLTCGISIWVWNKYAVVKVYGFDGRLANVMKQPRYVKDFSYWDNTDKPEEINGREWHRRRMFFFKSIEEIPIMSYIPYDFLSRNSFHAVLDLFNEHRKLREKEEGGTGMPRGRRR
ncbi:MAG: hypothetical protein ABIB71_08205 [Candidatus Woesearchaeota archaeon]